MTEYVWLRGNLKEVPVLRTGSKGEQYCYARVLVSNGRYDKNQQWIEGDPLEQSLHLRGKRATHLVDIANRCGNVQLVFGGRREHSYNHTQDGQRYLNFTIFVDEIGVSLTGSPITVTKPERGSVPAQVPSDQPAHQAAPVVQDPSPEVWPAPATPGEGIGQTPF